MRAGESQFLDIRGLRYHVRRWPHPGAPRLVLLHGWMDVSASFQFMVDELRGDWDVYAPDWRGYGLTEWSEADCYWFPDYLGDLDFILDEISPGEPVNLVGHSLGGNAAALYAGIRPGRVAKLVNLEGFGLPPTRPEQAPERYARWTWEGAQYSAQHIRDARFVGYPAGGHLLVGHDRDDLRAIVAFLEP